MLTRTLALVACFAISAGCVSKSKYEDLQAAYDDLEDRNEALLTKTASLIVDRGMLAVRVEALRERNDSLTGFYEDVLRDFGDAMDRGEVQLAIYPDHVALVFADDITFDTNEATLTTTGMNTIQRLGQLMQEHEGRDFEVQGHTDSRDIVSGRFENNWELGSARALSVVDVLLETGVDPDQLTAASYAATEPLATNRTESGRELNRRVEVALKPQLSDFPAHETLLWEAVSRQALNSRRADNASIASSR